MCTNFSLQLTIRLAVIFALTMPVTGLKVWVVVVCKPILVFSFVQTEQFILVRWVKECLLNFVVHNIVYIA